LANPISGNGGKRGRFLSLLKKTNIHKSPKSGEKLNTSPKSKNRKQRAGEEENDISHIWVKSKKKEG